MQKHIDGRKKPAHNRIDLSGQVFGRWSVIRSAPSKVGPTGKKKAMWFCKCSCGTERAVSGADLRNGKSVSCGCYSEELKRQRRKHGKAKSKVYKTWGNMKNRCLNEDTPDYKYYGAMGVTICDEWASSFENFYKDMGDPPTPEHTLERKDVEKGYSPENCIWATRKEQTRNRKCTIKYEYKGESKAASQWDEDLGLPLGTVHNRVTKLGWDVEKAIETPIKTHSKDWIEKLYLLGFHTDEICIALGVKRAWVAKVRRGLSLPKHGRYCIVPLLGQPDCD